MPGDSASYMTPYAAGLSVGLVGRYVPGRSDLDDARFSGLNNIPNGAEFGIVVESWPLAWLRLRGEVRQGIFGARGLTAVVSAVAVWKLPSLAGLVLDPDLPQKMNAPGLFSGLEVFRLGFGPRLVFGDALSHRRFNVSDTEAAAAADLWRYKSGGGLRSVGLEGVAYFPLNVSTTLRATVAYDRLVGPVVDSPVISARGEPNQMFLGVSLIYDFAVPSSLTARLPSF
jgi:outer membrane scaffolding protein for murein synthesis (MipA/OmpV family)